MWSCRLYRHANIVNILNSSELNFTVSSTPANSLLRLMFASKLILSIKNEKMSFDIFLLSLV